MATVNQIYSLVNDAADEALGKAAIKVKDTGSLVSLGHVVFSSTANVDAVYKALVDRITRTTAAIREYEAKNRSVRRNDLEWGFMWQKISYAKKNAVANPSWEFSTQANPFDVEVSTEIKVKVFGKRGTWSYEDSIPDYQLKTAFTSPEAMGAFISGIYMNIRNAMEMDQEDTDNMAVATNIAGVISANKPAQVRKLLTEFNTANNTTLTAAQALSDADFLKFAGREIRTVVRNMGKMTTVYNTEEIPRFTPKDKLVVEILEQFASATATYLESDTYHNDLVALPMYEEVIAWQGTGEGGFKFEDVSKVFIQNAEIGNDPIEKSGVIAFLHDYESCASIYTRLRESSLYNPRAERTNVFYKADKGYAVDLSENAVVFILE